MDMLTIDQKLAHYWVILRNDTLEPTALVAAATQMTRTKSFDIPIDLHTGITCYTCNEPNYLARDCLTHQMATTFKEGSRACEQGPCQEMLCFWSYPMGHLACTSPGKQDRGMGDNVSLFPGADKILTLVAITVQIEKKQSTALIDSGFLQIISQQRCVPITDKKVCACDDYQQTD